MTNVRTWGFCFCKSQNQEANKIADLKLHPLPALHEAVSFRLLFRECRDKPVTAADFSVYNNIYKTKIKRLVMRIRLYLYRILCSKWITERVIKFWAMLSSRMLKLDDISCRDRHQDVRGGGVGAEKMKDRNPIPRCFSPFTNVNN